MSDLIQKFNTNKKIHFYWIFLYAYDSKQFTQERMENNIYIFPFSYYTIYNNRALWVFYSDRQLDLNSDDDLDLILKKFRISNVKSMSELNINSNTNIICFEIENRDYKRFKRHTNLLFYTSKHSPSYYINQSEYLNSDEDYVMVPNNTDLLAKLKIHLPNLGIVTTKVVLNKVFSFLFNDLFETMLTNVVVSKKEDREEERQRMLDKYLEKSRESIREMLEAIKEKNKEQEVSDYETEEEEEDEDGYDTDDSHLSWYSYCKKYGMPTKEKVIE